MVPRQSHSSPPGCLQLRQHARQHLADVAWQLDVMAQRLTNAGLCTPLSKNLALQARSAVKHLGQA